MKIFLAGNCQSDQIMTALRAVLSPRIVISGGRFSPHNWTTETPAEMIETARRADIFLTHYDAKHFLPVIDAQKIIVIPDLCFSGFHPDQTRLQIADKPGEKLKTSIRFRESDHHLRLNVASALATWAFKKRLPVSKTAALFRADVFERLGYFQAFEIGYEAMRERFAQLDLDFRPMARLMHARVISMWGMEHPKMALTLCLCESILQRLGLAGGERFRPLAATLVDDLEREYACGCFPPIAEHLGVEGSWAMRIGESLHVDVASYVTEFFFLLSGYAPEKIQILDQDAGIFRFDEMDSALAGCV